MNRYRLFLDANVLFTAAHNPDGKAAFLITLANDGYWQVVTSDLAIEEVRRNLERKYPRAMAQLEVLLNAVRIVASPAVTDSPINLPEKDRPIFAAARSCRATHLLTGDRKHFGPFFNQPQICAGIMIQTVSDFLAAI
ncbi:DNA-binding protein [Geothermobacter hydrogeniphilus]|uniref:DNA-binding protein n=1 Tax=Geothermobacter hydrogeniphilus TaxID=1969733 RepID=A0A2K2HDN4_9BACT|nr:PIN domain-containing protein [Geothermobacter hydrogeniphilus]PNU21407.1 DNA-binding protein [Geothermobacter hydrogeniphilus]